MTDAQVVVAAVAGVCWLFLVLCADGVPDVPETLGEGRGVDGDIGAIGLMRPVCQSAARAGAGESGVEYPACRHRTAGRSGGSSLPRPWELRMTCPGFLTALWRCPVKNLD